ncbi:MAG: hypothetical protein HZB65_02540 [Candidatus Aenigmarchaeota archaeon]|nr:hypothetical protein [Candidatus Aenigmarchaeota archaeon]
MAFRSTPGFKPAVNPIIFWSIIGIALVVIVIAGFLISESCIEISGCKACWSNIDRTKQSSACPENQTCKVESYVDQHNAVTSALLCACSKANVNNDYPDTSLNNRIIDIYSSLYGTRPSVQEVCESGGLVRVRY